MSGGSRPTSGLPSGDVPVRAGGGDLVAWNVLAYLVSGLAIFGGGGLALDRWLGTEVLTPLGMILGTGLSLYVIWVRYGGRRPSGEGPGDATSRRGPAPGPGEGRS